jgi:type I restriction enzyme, S subunit
MEKDNQTSNLPSGWVWTTLDKIGIITSGGTPSTNQSRFWGGDIGWITPADMSNFNEKYISKGKRNITQDGLDYSAAKLIPENSILFSSRAPIGYVVIAKNPLATNQGFKNLIPTPSLNSDYVYYYLKSIKQLAESMASGTTFLELSASKFAQLPFPLAPFDEQLRITSKIEEMFNELDLAEKMFLKIQKKIKIYKQVILRSAFNGELTKKWRETDSTISAFDFLLEISKNRKSKYEQSLIATNKKGSIKKNYDFEFNSNPNIPRWAVAKLDKLISISARVGWKGLKKEEYTKEGPLFLSVHSLNYGKYVEFKDAYHITEERYEESPEIKLAVNDILLCKDGSGIGKLGIVKQLPDKATINSSLAIVRGYEVFLPDYLYYLFLGPQLQSIVNERISGSAIPHLFQKDIREFILNIPPPGEQSEIVKEIEYRFTIAEKLEEIITTNQKRISSFRKKILQNAFTGNLITPDANSESAEILLKQIALEKLDFFKKQKLVENEKPKKKRIMDEKKTILEVLKSSQSPIPAEEVWLQSEHKDKIENFYAALKLIQDDVIAVKKGAQSLLSLKNENR